MKVVFVLLLAIASACAYAIKSEDEIVPIYRVMPVFDQESRITNGKTASITDFPYQVGLLIGGSSWCGGSLISTTWILTAAHCVDSVSAGNVAAYMGSATRLGGTKRTAKRKIVHSGWNANTLLNDIALLEIDAVTTSSSIKPVSLPALSTTATYADTTAVASGWGKTSDTSSVASTLQYADLKVITNSKCSETYGSTIKSSNICTSTSSGVSTCNGDSGGPLYSKTSGVQIGIVSFGSSAGCTKNYPAAFTRVTSYRQWIKDNTGV